MARKKKPRYKVGQWVYRINAKNCKEPNYQGKVVKAWVNNRGTIWYRVQTPDGKLFEAKQVPDRDEDYRDRDFYVEDLPGKGPVLGCPEFEINEKS